MEELTTECYPPQSLATHSIALHHHQSSTRTKKCIELTKAVNKVPSRAQRRRIANLQVGDKVDRRPGIVD